MLEKRRDGTPCARCGTTDREVARIKDGPWSCHPMGCPESELGRAFAALGEVARLRREIEEDELDIYLAEQLTDPEFADHYRAAEAAADAQTQPRWAHRLRRANP